MAKLALVNVGKRFGNTRVIDDISLEVDDGELVVFVGPSGCGKSTLLRMIAGLEHPDEGEIHIGGQRIDHKPPAARGIAMVFQSYALYPHKDVRGNLGFALRHAGVAREEIRRRVDAAAGILGLHDLMDRKPRELSGGQRQRVAIGRAIVREPEVFLFDEPLSNLDAALRVHMRVEILKLHRRLSSTMIYVTHDQVEAMTIADRIVILNQGRIEQIGSPMTLYRKPANRFVAGFLGSPAMNFLDARSEHGELLLGSQRICRSDAPDGPVTLGLRPEHLRASSDGILQGTVDVFEQLGGESWVHLTLADGQNLVARLDAAELSPGDTLAVAVEAGHCHLFDRDGQAIGFGKP